VGLREKAEKDLESLDDAEWAQLVAALRPLLAESAGVHARDALLGIYTRGDAALQVTSHARIVRRAEEATLDVHSVAAFAHLRELLLAERSEELGAAAQALEERGRDTLRDVLAEGLAAEGVAQDTVNAVLESLEWRFTARDQDADLADESFRVRIAMPGTIVGGDYDRLEDGWAVWERRGAELTGADWRMRVVSVLE
jgi:hypothetical protein